MASLWQEAISKHGWDEKQGSDRVKYDRYQHTVTPAGLLEALTKNKDLVKI